MSEKIVQLNEDVIKRELKELVRDSVEKTLNELLKAVGEIFPEANPPRCTVHFYRNVFSVTPCSKMKFVAKMLGTIHAQESKKARAVVEELRSMKHLEAALEAVFIAG